MNDFVVDNPRAVLDELCRHNFLAFLRKAWPYINGGEALLYNWHLDAIAEALDAIRRGDSKRLIANLPPRNGKSLMISVIWVAWMLGQDPSLNVVCVSYSNELSAKLARDCRAIMESSWYKALFPKTQISKTRSAAYDFETTAGGGRLATSITGSLTGRGGDIIILDDVIKPDDAMSETQRSAVNNWFRSTLASRLNDKASGAIISVMQRLHQDDLCGMLLEEGGWDHLSLAAIAEADETIPLTRGRVYHRKAGEALHPARESVEQLEKLKREMGSVLFQAQYQQNPVPTDGNMISADWLKYAPLDTSKPAQGLIVQSWDTASKDGIHNDWSVCITAALIGRDVWIVDVHRARYGFPDLKKAAHRLAGEWSAQIVLIEDAASGQQLLQTLRAEGTLHAEIIRCAPEGDKLSRLSGVSALIEAGHLVLPEAAPWLATLMHELLAFPNGRHDDQVDALAQLLHWARRGMAFGTEAIGGAEVLTYTDARPSHSPDNWLDTIIV